MFKALALGANAISIGHPYIWGLASFGQEGVEAVIRMIQAKFELVMRHAGTASIEKITRECLVDSGTR